MTTRAPLRIAVLASGRGSNFQALAEAIAEQRLHAQVVGVFSDRPRAAVLERARALGIPAWSMAPARAPSRAAFEQMLFDAVAAVQPQLIVLAGYMRIVSDAQVARWHARMVNIHPSLLPRHPGLDTHARALAAGDVEHGATVHYVTAELDGGPAIAQARVPVLAGDDAERLAARVLGREHQLLVATVAGIAGGAIELAADDRVLFQGQALLQPLRLDASGTLQAVPPTDATPAYAADPHAALADPVHPDAKRPGPNASGA